MTEEFWENYYTLKKHDRKLAREFYRLARVRARIERMNQKWIVDCRQFHEDINVESLKLDLEMWNMEAEE